MLFLIERGGYCGCRVVVCGVMYNGGGLYVCSVSM